MLRLPLETYTDRMTTVGGSSQLRLAESPKLAGLCPDRSRSSMTIDLADIRLLDRHTADPNNLLT
jgi:hypothetical protein